MKINGRDIIFKEKFRNALEDTIEYLEQFGNQPAKNFLKDLDYLKVNAVETWQCRPSTKPHPTSPYATTHCFGGFYPSIVNFHRRVFL